MIATLETYVVGLVENVFALSVAGIDLTINQRGISTSSSGQKVNS